MSSQGLQFLGFQGVGHRGPCFKNKSQISIPSRLNEYTRKGIMTDFEAQSLDV